MPHIAANHAKSTRKDDAKYDGKGDKENNIFNPFNGRVADPEQQDIVQVANNNNPHVSFPWIFKREQQKNDTCTESNTHTVTGSDVHLFLFDIFHERNTMSKTEALIRIGYIPESNGKFNSEIEEQLHLKFDNDKKFLNMMQPATHIYLFRSIINHHNNRLIEKCLRDFGKRLQFPVKRNDLGSLVYVIPSCCNEQSELETTVIRSEENLEQCQTEFGESYADVPNNECSFKESLGGANTDTEADNLKTYRNRQLNPEAQSDCETDNTSINETFDT